MIKYITVKLTEEQAELIHRQLHDKLNELADGDAKKNLGEWEFIIRIVTKLNYALKNAE